MPSSCRAGDVVEGIFGNIQDAGERRLFYPSRGRSPPVPPCVRLSTNAGPCQKVHGVEDLGHAPSPRPFVFTLRPFVFATGFGAIVLILSIMTAAGPR